MTLHLPENLQTTNTASMEPSVKVVMHELVNRRNIVLLDEYSNQALMFCAARNITAHAINQMASDARGIISLALRPERFARLGLRLQTLRNRTNQVQCYGVSIEAAHGITTGISAADRAHTICVAAAEDACALDLVSPGHVFPVCVESRSEGSGLQIDLLSNLNAILRAIHNSGQGDGAVFCHMLTDDGQVASTVQAQAIGRKAKLLIIRRTELDRIAQSI